MNARRCLALALLGCLALPATAVAGAGDRDSAFGEDGARTYGLDTAPGSPSDGAVAALPQPGGGALLVGAIRTEALDPNGNRIDRVALLRTTSTGAPDTSFGPDGLVLLPAAVGTVAHDAVALPDGDVLVLAGGVSDGAGHGEYVLFRANADGTPDTSFSGDGLVQTGYDAFRDVPVDGGPGSGYGVSGRALALVGGRAVVAAAVIAHADFTESSSYSYSSAVAAHDPATGALDAAWGTRSGTTLLAPPSGYASFAQVADVAAAPGGKALVLDELVPSGSLERAAVHRLADDGTRDPTFGDADPGDPTDDGVAIVRFKPGAADGTVAEDGTAVLALPRGGVAVAGGLTPLDDPLPARQQAAVARLTDTGDADGVALVDGGQDGDRAFEALALVEGALHAAGRNVDHDGTGPGQREGWLVRFTGEDAPFAADPGFGVDGIARGGVPSWVHDLAATDDGFALAAGAAASSDDTAWTAARWDARDARLPVNAERPRVADAGIGIVAVGETLTAFDGTWHYGDVVTRRWQRCTTAHDPSAPAAGAGCTDIADATGREYTVTPADADRHLRVVVTNASGTFTATAAAATIEAYAPPEPTAFTTPPAVAPTGSVPAGTTVRATWTATGAQPLDADVRWFRCPTATTGPCEPVTGDDTTDATYLASPADVGTFLRAIVELSGPGGFDSAQTTNATGVTAATDAPAPQATVAPTTTPAGPVTEGTTLSRASDGTWDQDGLAFTHRWERCDAAGAGCAPIPGAGAPSYATTSADVGRRVRLVVEARRGSGPLGASASASTAVSPRPQPPVAVTPPPPVTPVGPGGPIVYADSTTTKVMPDVRGLPIDAAKARIEKAGIVAAVDARETIRATPRKLAGKALDVGDVSAQSVAQGTKVTSSLGAPRAIRLVTEAGPKATAATGGPSGSVCTGAAIREDLKGLGLGEVFELLQAKRCTRLDVDFTVSNAAKELEVRRATKDGGDLKLTVVVPGRPANLDLTPVFRQGAFNSRPSFGQDDWALTADATNIMGVQVINRAGATIDGAQVLIDGSKVGADDVLARATGGVLARGFSPKQAGVVNVLVQQEDARGNRVFGFGRFKVVERRSAFTAIDGRRYTAQGAPAGPAARAASVGAFFSALGRLVQDLGAGAARFFTGPVTTTTITTAAKANVGVAQLSLGQILSGSAGVVSAGGANVVSAGGGNVVAAGGGNVVSAGGGNLLSIAQGNVVAAGGGNVIGKETMKDGIGRLLAMPAGVVSAGGGNVIAAGGGNVIAAGGGNVVAAGGGNVIAAGGGNVIAAGGGNVIAAGGGNVIAAGGGNVVAAGGGN